MVGRVPTVGPMAFGRGVEVEIEFDEEAFAGSSVFLLGMVLDEFMGRYVSINSFSKCVIASRQRGALVRWPARAGEKALL